MKKIPDWAEKAISSHRPLPVAAAPDGQPNPKSLELWEQYSKRFRKEWWQLDAERWSVSEGPEGSHQRSSILIAALDCAKRIGKGVDPLKIFSVRRDLLRMQEEISELAGQLVQKFEALDFIESSTGVIEWRRDDRGLDALDLWDAMEIAFNPGPETGYPHPMGDVWPDLSQALNRARSTSLSVPEWPDLLRPLAHRFEYGALLGEFPDITTVGHTTNKSKYSPWCNCLISMLADWHLLECLSLNQLSALASIAFDSPEGEINSKQIGGLKKTFLKNR